MTRGGEKLRQHDDRPRELEWFGPLVLSMKTAERNIHCLSRMDAPAFQHKKKGPPFSRGPFPFYEALRAPAHPGSKPGIRSDSLRGVTPGGQNLTWLLLLGFLVGFLCCFVVGSVVFSGWSVLGTCGWVSGWYVVVCIGSIVLILVDLF